ncbi:MAG TPA: DUF3426 domain-containing protein [Gammaproteobacteria bacterium]|nr:DUF3426 domain-containing protein [Gammaproteobacteria bacterium]
MYTQCPHCDTLFRIQVADLRTAQGKVRCGRCGQIFNALRYLSEELPEIPTVFEMVELPAPEVEPADVAADELHSTEELLGLVDKLVSELEPALSPVEGPAASPATETPPAPELVTVIPEDEAPLLSEITEFKQIDVYEVTSPGVSFESIGTPFSIVEPPAGVAEEIARAAERVRTTKAQRHSGLGTFSWSVAILVLVAVLAAQYIYYMRAELSQNAVLHPWLERYCEVVKAVAPCEVTPLRDLAKIEIQNREIRVHPSIQDVLLVRLSLMNRASFAQPYPDLQLTLSDLGGRHFAQRRFHPAEYLSPGSDIAQGMRRNVSVPVTLEIAAPFSPANLEASSWSFRLY